jgi:hypothetical protein
LPGPTLVIGSTYLFAHPGLPTFYGAVVAAFPDLGEPVHVWIDHTGRPPEHNPVLVILGPGWVVSPDTPPAGG